MSSNWQNLKRFACVYIRPRAAMFAFVQVLHVMASGLILLPPLAVRYVIDVALPERSFRLLALGAGAIAGVFGLFFILAALKEYWGHEVAQRITSRLRNDLYGHFQKLSMSFHDREKAGSLLARVVDDINVVQEVTHHGPEAIVLAVVMVSGTAALLFYFSWQLALVAIAFIVPLAVFVRLTAAKMWERFREVRKRVASLSEVIEENLSGIHVIKAFGSEDREGDAVSHENAMHYRSRMNVIRYMAPLFPGALLINNLALAAVIFYGGYMVIQGSMEVGTLVAFMMWLRLFLHPIVRAVMMLEQAGRFFASLERFFEYMGIEPDIQDALDSVQLREVRGEVAFEDVHFAYDDRPILQGVSFTAPAGKMIALVGPSGAGKTTVTRLVPRFYEPQQGRILVDGRDIRHIKLRSLRSHIAMVMQDDFLFSGTAAENIAYGRPDATREQVIEMAKLANADEFLEQMPDGYETEIGKRGVRLSEGQRQRVSIARALLKNPRILLLDEATSSVDPETELLIQTAMERLRKGRTTFVIAHRLSTIFSADQILFIQDGRIIERGTHRELLDHDGEYARFFRIQFRERQYA